MLRLRDWWNGDVGRLVDFWETLWESVLDWEIGGEGDVRSFFGRDQDLAARLWGSTLLMDMFSSVMKLEV